MKKFMLISIVFLTMILTTGCIKYSYDIEIDKDNNISISETQAINTAMFDTYGVSDELLKGLDEQKGELEEQGYEASVYNKDAFKGLTRKKTYKIDKLYKSNLPEGFKSNTKKPIEVKSFLGIKDTYSIDWNYSFKKAVEENSSQKDMEDVNFDSKEAINIPGLQPQAELVIKIPCKSIHDNATSIVGTNELHWNLIDADNDSVHVMLKYDKYNFTAIFGFLALIIAAVGFIILYKVLKRDDVVY